jgi:hypothetical protein
MSLSRSFVFNNIMGLSCIFISPFSPLQHSGIQAKGLDCNDMHFRSQSPIFA